MNGNLPFFVLSRYSGILHDNLAYAVLRQESIPMVYPDDLVANLLGDIVLLFRDHFGHQGLATETVGPYRQKVQGIWLNLTMVPSNPYFIDMAGIGYRVYFAGEIAHDSFGGHPVMIPQPVYPAQYQQPETVGRENILQEAMQHLSIQMRQTKDAEFLSQAEGLLQRAISLFLAPIP